MTDETRRDYEQVISYLTNPAPWNHGNHVPDRHYEIAGRAMMLAGGLDKNQRLDQVARRAVRLLQECLKRGEEL